MKGSGSTPLKTESGLVDETNPLPTALPSAGTDGYGLLQTGSPYQTIAARTVNLADTNIWTTFAGGTGSVTARGQNGDATISSGTTANGFGTLVTVEEVPFHPGVSSAFQWDTCFQTVGTLPIAIVGPYHAEAGMGVGYFVGQNSNAPGFLFRRLRRLEVQELRITTGASSGSTCTVTLDGAAHVVTLTTGSLPSGVSQVEVNAREIADFASGYAGSDGVAWLPYAYTEDDGTTARVAFLRQTHGDATGTMSYAAGSTGSAASFTEVQTGANGTNTIETFNIDTLSATAPNPSGETIDWAVYNLWRLIGVDDGPWTLYWQSPTTGTWVAVHRKVWHNQSGSTAPMFADPSFPFTIAASTADTSETALRVGHVEGWMIGYSPSMEENRTVHWDSAVEETAVTATEVPRLSIQCARTDSVLGRVSRRRMILEAVRVGNSGSKPVRVKLYIGSPTDLTGYAFSQPDVNRPLWQDTASTAKSGTFSAVRDLLIELEGGESGTVARNIPIQPGEVCIVTVQTTSGQSSTATIELEGRFDR